MARVKITACRAKSQPLTHLVLVREVVGIKGLRGEEPPEEQNSVKPRTQIPDLPS